MCCSLYIRFNVYVIAGCHSATCRYPNDPEQLPPTQSASASQQERATQTEEEEVLPVEGEEEDELLIAGKGSRSTRVMQWLLDRVAGKGR
jgi:hypothetical protein